MSSVLYLGSQSSARHILLRQAAIPFVVVPLTVQEEDATVSGSVAEQVEALAAYKHSGLDLDALVAAHQPDKNQPLFFLTADTLIAGGENNCIYGKPQNKDHAAQMIREIAAQEIDIVTGMCLSIYRYNQSERRWTQDVHELWHAGARAVFAVDEDMIETYLASCPAAMLACGATVIEEIGIRYFRSINGSYTGALGIDLFTLNQRLKKFGFFQTA